MIHGNILKKPQILYLPLYLLFHCFYFLNETFFKVN